MHMSKIMTPGDMLNLQVKEFNKGNISFLMTLYENDACFASKPGQVVRDLESMRRTLQGLIDMGGKLEARVKRLLHSSDLALLITEWSINGSQKEHTHIIFADWYGILLLMVPPPSLHRISYYKY
jgi:ketosteroid isomerase-like protein